MFCPNCGFEDRADSKFCKRCGTNLRALTLVMAGKPQEREDEEFVRKLAIQQELANQQSLVKKRQGMITGGIICAFSGLGVMVFLTSIESIKAGMVGIIPLMVGVGLTLSALLLYKPKDYLKGFTGQLPDPAQQVGAQSQRVLPNYPESVTAETTRRFEGMKPAPPMKE